MIACLLDTHLCSFTIENPPPEIRKSFRGHDRLIVISTVPVMEWISGAEQ